MNVALDTGNTAWMLTSAALVLLMIPGLAFFYGGMVRAKSVLNMLMMVMGSLFTVGVLWIVFGYSMTFGSDIGGLIGNPTQFLGLDGLIEIDPEASLPIMAFVAFQGMFACLTVGLIAGAIPDRTNFNGWLIFGALWATLVYFPVAHWVWASGGWILELGVIDFAGGTAVHINAGAAALAIAFVVGKRSGWPKTPMRPHNLTLVMIGAALLWFGWFGFNAGSALSADNTSAVVFVNTFGATCAAAIGWLVVERTRDGHMTTLGAASGIVAGLVAITPACSAVSPLGALVIGVLAGALCAMAVGWKFRFGLDDSLDVVGIHLVGGVLGTLLIGLLATDVAPAGVNGLLYGGGFDQLGKQAIGAGAVMVYSFVMALIIAGILHRMKIMRIVEDSEVTGIDINEHAENAYEWHETTSAGTLSAHAASADVSVKSFQEGQR